jgi:hypothetical protein
MQVLEAKDFLVQQTAEQAEREGVALSELEKRMMYFTQEQRLAATFEAQGKQSRPLHRQPPEKAKTPATGGRYTGKTPDNQTEPACSFPVTVNAIS